MLTNMTVSIEQYVAWIGDYIETLRATGHRAIEATPAAADRWVDHVNAVADTTLMGRVQQAV